MTETENIDRYICQHIEPEGDYLYHLYRATNIHTIHGRMASGHIQGRLLKMLVQMIRPKNILEVGTFSGYSAICIAEGLAEGGKLYTFEINDEMEDFTRPWIHPCRQYALGRTRHRPSIQQGPSDTRHQEVQRFHRTRPKGRSRDSTIKRWLDIDSEKVKLGTSKHTFINKVTSLRLPIDKHRDVFLFIQYIISHS